MTAPIIGHWSRRGYPARLDYEGYATEMSNADKASVAWTRKSTAGQLWPRIAEGKRRDG